MEPLNSDFADSKTDIISLETIDCRTPSPVTSEAASHCQISSSPSKDINVLEAALEDRKDVILRLMGHLTPGSARTAERSAIETDSSVDSSPSALQERLQNLPPPTQTSKLSDRAAVLSRNFLEDCEFYLHLQDLKNSVEEQSEGNLDKTGSSKTDDFVSNWQHHSTINNARARRRERLNAGLPMSQVISPSLSSAEGLADLIREDFTEEINQISSTIGDRHGFDDPLVHLMREDAAMGPSGSSLRHDLHKRNLEDSNDISSMDHFTNHVVSSEASDTVAQAISSIVAPIGLGYAYTTQKRTPIKFGGYRPAPGLIFRNMSSESESDTDADRVIGRKEFNPQHGYTVQSLSSVQSSSNRMAQVEPLDMKNFEFKERRLLSPVISVDSRLFCDESKSVEEIERTSEIGSVRKTEWVTETPNGAEECMNNTATHLKNTPFHENNSVESLERNNQVSISKNSSSSSLALDQKSLQISKKRSTTLLPIIPPLKIDSQGQSQSQSLTSEERDDRAKESLDVNALIQALSNVSLKQGSRKDQMSIEQKSPFSYPGPRFSGSSCPRSSEYTPAVSGSRQSLTSLEVSDAHSLKTSMAESKTQRTSAPPLLKLNAQSARSIPRTFKVLENLSRPRSCISKYQMTNSEPLDGQTSEVDLLRSSTFIPVVAKMNKTNLTCPKRPSTIKAIEKLLSPRKYPKTEVAGPLSSRTDVSYLSEASRKSFRSLKSVPLGPIIRSQKRGDCASQLTKDIRPSAPIFGRKILEPLNLVPKVRRDCPVELSRTIERRKKSVNDLSEVNNGYEGTRRNGPRAMIPDQSSCEETPPLRDARGRVPRPKKTNPRKSQMVHNGNESSTTHSCMLYSNDRKTLGEDSQKVKGSKYTEISSGLQLQDSVEPVTEFVRSPYRSRGPSVSSEDYQERTDCYHPSENELSTLHIQGKKCKLFSQEDTISSETTRSLGYCVHLNDLQDGREVTLLCGNPNVEKKGVKKIELFESLPNEISASLTRHEALEIQAAENLSSTKQLPNTIEDLERNIQENNDQWVKNFKSDGEKISLEETDGISAISSPMRFNVYSPLQESVESASLKSYVSSTVEPQSSADSSPLHDKPCQPDSQRSSLFCTSPISQRNTSCSPAESNNSTLCLPITPCQEVDVQNVAEPIAPHLPCMIVESRPKNIRMESILDDEDVALETMPPGEGSLEVAEKGGDESELERISKTSEMVMETEPTLEFSRLQNSHDPEEGCEREEQWSAEFDDYKMHVQHANEKEHYTSTDASADNVAHQNPKKHDEKKRFLSSDGSAKSPHRFDLVTYSPMPMRSFSSMSKLSSSLEPKWDVTDVTVANSGRKSQERFPFTISENTSMKTSNNKFKIVEAVSSKQLTFHDQNTQTEPNELVGTQSVIHVESGHPEKATDYLKPFLDGLTDWKTSATLSYGLNDMSYRYQEEPQSLFPNVKGMVKRFSSKLRCSKHKQFSNPKKKMIEILYKNKNCHCESMGGGSSSVTSSNESRILTVSLAQESKDHSKTSSVEKILSPKRNSEHFRLSLGSASKVCDQDDLWIQEFDSDEEFHVGKTEVSIPSRNPHVDDGYSMFMARRKFPEIDTKGGGERIETNPATLVYFEGGDTKKVVCKVADGVIEPFIQAQDMVTESTKAPTNFWKDTDSELELNSRENDCQDYIAKNGCCCFRICRLFRNPFKRDIASRNHNLKERRRTELRKKK